MMNPQIAILISGRGSNMAAIHHACMAGTIPAKIAFVGSDNPQAKGLGYAKQQQIPTLLLPYDQSRATAEMMLCDALENVSLLCLAGFMKILSKDFIENAPCGIINIHPSILPELPGLNTHQRAIQQDLTHHGCTVHEVTAALDSGTILAQRIIPMPANITKEQLAAKILEQEHQIYSKVIAQLLDAHSGSDTEQKKKICLP